MICSAGKFSNAKPSAIRFSPVSVAKPVKTQALRKDGVKFAGLTNSGLSSKAASSLSPSSFLNLNSLISITSTSKRLNMYVAAAAAASSKTASCQISKSRDVSFSQKPVSDALGLTFHHEDLEFYRKPDVAQLLDSEEDTLRSGDPLSHGHVDSHASSVVSTSHVSPPLSSSKKSARPSHVETSFRVWAPHAASVSLLLKERNISIPLLRHANDTWACRLSAGEISAGDAYAVEIRTADGRTVVRRDPYAHSADYDSHWCMADDPDSFPWSDATLGRGPRPFDEYIIYELHVGSFTPEGTLAAAMAKLDHVSKLGFTAVQLMPLTEHSDSWGYNPRQLLALHGKYGSPADMRCFVDRAHALGLSVIVDVVLHHGAVDANALWEYDGWSDGGGNGGIYHEGAPDTQWGRAYAFWKSEVRQMTLDACAIWLDAFRCDGLRFDSANDLPGDLVQHLTWTLHQRFPGRILTAEITPEDPRGIKELGFDSLWVHSGYFDIIQQHRALGRGHHGGGDWAEGWNLPRLRTAMGMHFGFEWPTQCVKYLLGSHDQIGCRKGGAWYKDYEMIGGQHRYPADQYGGGRHDPAAVACVRLWYGANVAAAGLPLVFMGTEVAMSGWWNSDEADRRMQWALADDEVGNNMAAFFADVHRLRTRYPALRRGWPQTLHEDRPNGVLAFERQGVEVANASKEVQTAKEEDGEVRREEKTIGEDGCRIVTVVNAGRGCWTDFKYSVWVGWGVFNEVFCSQAPQYGGFENSVSNYGAVLAAQDGWLRINLPPQCTLVFAQCG
nr:starch branching enzyme (1,4-alpha-glucan branching enzyme II) (SBE2) [Polytomella parva]|mmetsp:Transcript_29695/g.54444  ORF Transcript_29695/g.54444 Transcript_29695/m.54444 type:complete len:784 (-) Transcript_29695:145-2496(-)|eukprot:CAMPEP_0175081432 /NCGR_PEP_ID=MMETSP0052_2-20121109/26144_1 /TAXON_ID=51329 ORGANISM="Polytomella parva, Strain SAG 63-3" /NCGR_SAMPLE_ID=MMETSP0052_2 /ASSEMBLY_ACC=CAM_ASM_000194 /LENGTH=783 /DNA_ID=CAMNT_0016352411 /DNA_START=168 /DNA_END=2519 /DNA_ORIENTATION=+